LSVGTHADHLAQDSVSRDAATDSRLTPRTRAATASDARLAAAAVAGSEHEVGSWGPLVDWPVVGIHAALLPNGKVLAWDSVGDRAAESYTEHNFTAPPSGIPQRGRTLLCGWARASTPSALVSRT
jgi:hypothetical protein